MARQAKRARENSGKHGCLGVNIRRAGGAIPGEGMDELKCPMCYNAMGPYECRDRSVALVDPEILREYGNGEDKGLYPPRWAYEKGEKAENGNYIEPEGTEVRYGVCGDPKQDTNEDQNEYSLPNSNFEVLGSYAQGQVIEIKVIITAYHWGHFEFKLCNAADLDDPSGVVTTKCLQMHQLSRAPDDGDASPIDPEHPGRYFPGPECREQETDQSGDWVGGGYVETMRYMLPEDLTCSHCILQMYHYTGHRCRHPGYAEFNPPSWPSECAPNKSDWIYEEGRAEDVCGDGEWVYPEEFWGCADIEITADGGDGGSNEEAENMDPPSETPAPVNTEPPTTDEQPVTSTDPPVTSDTPAPVSTEPPTTDTMPVVGTIDEGASTPAPATTSPGEECSGDPVAAYDQCGGYLWTGATCCEDGHKCVEMGDKSCYSQCRPVGEDVEDTTPSPASSVAPPTSDTEMPVALQTDDDCMAVVIEAEGIELTGEWKVVSDPDAIGGEYIVWEGMSDGDNNRDPEDGDIISTTIDISTPGTYRFKWRMRQPSGVGDDKGNDSWLNFPDATRFGPVEHSTSEYGEFIKVYGRATEGAFEYSGTAEEDNHGHTQIAVEFERAGEYIMELAGRSHGHQIDQIVLFAEALDVEHAAAGCPP